MTNILLIDLSSIAHQEYHTSGNDPDPNAAAVKTVARIRALASGQAHVAIAADSGKSFRHELSADYKAQRDRTHNAAVAHQIATAIDVLKADGFPVWAAPGFEADDVLASATALALLHEDIDVTIVSADKDMEQLVRQHVVIHKLDGRVFDEDKVLL